MSRLGIPELLSTRRHRKRKVRRQRTDNGKPTRSLETLLEDLRTLTKNRVEGTEVTFDKYTRPTPLQEKAFELLDVSFRM